MPPMISDDESDGVDVPDAIPAKASKLDQTVDELDEDMNEDADEDEEDPEDEYEIEKILDHKFDKGAIAYKVKWLGYEDEKDQTWEPAENLEHATERLNDYKKLIGGSPEPPKSAKRSASTKRGVKRAAEDTPTSNPKKKGRPSNKSKTKSSETNGVKQDYKYPDGSWEGSVTQVVSIIEDSILIGQGRAFPEDSSLFGFLKWNDGHQSQHPMRVLRLKCPQKLIDYFEQHLTFTANCSCIYVVGRIC
ncbi:hypothetical protein K431DRAFT_169687 [Polychaeton citri CBS 116435]|uniref:Chromo domain-containing protein n=1 Tax=Polychaeton citri CBS 116435 TaxID=1314669 RepID=A0A9P4ULD4_9PEZI|nr:hypothetical protein K431DRAFT_169687 [Polychaeton citri CBS 116435]